MTRNRLDLDFSLETSIERNNFVKEYLKNDIFKKKPPTDKEIETISNYILFGKEEDGKSIVQKKEISIETKNKTWSREKDDIESIEELLETPGFDENTLTPIGEEAPVKKKKEVFSREKALEEAPENLRPVFIELFRQIDYTDLLINYYEVQHNKRKTPPRPQLLNKFTEEEKEKAYQVAASISNYNYLKMRHHLVELRATQFTIRDSYKRRLVLETRYHLKPVGEKFSLSDDIPIFPLGVKNNKMISNLIFVNESELENKKYTDREFQEISKFFWAQDKLEKEKENIKLYFDFSNPEHLYNLLLHYPDLEKTSEEGDSSVKSLLDTLNFYISLAELSDSHTDLLNMKIAQKKNLEIATLLNEKYNKSYTENYISTLFKQKIITKIAKAAEFHKDLIENIYFPENFRYCTTCHRYLLKHPRNFVRKARSKDGYCGRCKECDKKNRVNKKRK